MDKNDWEEGYRQAFNGEKINKNGVRDDLAFAAGRVEGESDRLLGRASRVGEGEEVETEEKIGPK